MNLLSSLQVENDTMIVFTADHAQNLGEANMWSMMNLLETSLRIPLIIRPAATDTRFHAGGTVPQAKIYPHQVELVDLFPTLAGVAGLRPPPSQWALDGDDLTMGMISGQVSKEVNAAFGQITRCMNCTQSYGTDTSSYQGGCTADSQDVGKFFVPCAHTNRTSFDLMGMTVRTDDWRYTVFCKYVGVLAVVRTHLSFYFVKPRSFKDEHVSDVL